MGEGRAGKTALLRALRNLPFENTDSTAGIATNTLETAALRNWVEVKGVDGEKVTRHITSRRDRRACALMGATLITRSIVSISQQALARAVAQFQKMEKKIQATLKTAKDKKDIKAQRAVLEAALKKASHVALNPATSAVAKDLRKRLDKAMIYVFPRFKIKLDNNL